MCERLRQPGIPQHVRTLVLTVLALAVPIVSVAQTDDSGAAQFDIDSESSWLRVLVYRGGLLRGLGHNHVVSHTEITGTVTVGEDPLQSELVLEFRVANLEVDDPELRALAGSDFPPQISEKDNTGTRANKLGKKLLQAEQFPAIQIRSEQITGDMPDIEVEANIVVRGTEFAVVFPARLELSSDSFIARGKLEITHAEMGLKPFKAMLGTLRVRDTLILNYEISGKRTITSE